MKDEALKLALEALEMYVMETDSQFQREAITAIKQALAAPAVQEPVAYVVTTEVHGQMFSFIHRIDLTKLLPDGAKLYTTPPAAQPAPVQELQRYSPSGEGGMEMDSLGAYVKHQDVTTPPAAQRQWVGLTEDEINEVYAIVRPNVRQFWEICEAKLKEKNT